VSTQAAGWSQQRATSSGVIDLSGCSHVRVTGVELRNGGLSGIRLGGSQNVSNVEISDVTIRNCWRGIEYVENSSEGSHILITHASILNGMPQHWGWYGGYAVEGVDYAIGDPSFRGCGLYLYGLLDSEIKECTILGQWDGMAVRKARVKIHHNTIGHILDDGIELESPYSANIEFFNNHIHTAFTGISVTSNSPGPVYIYRNVVETPRTQALQTPWSENNGYSVKSGNNFSGSAQNVKFYHNTFYSNNSNVWEKTDDSYPDQWSGYDFVNNIFYASIPGRGNVRFRGESVTTSGPNNHWEGNIYNQDDPGADETNPMTRTAMAGYFIEAGEIGRDLRLRRGTVPKDSGGDYASNQGWPDSVTEFPGGRDRGAWEDGMADDAIGVPLPPAVDIIMDNTAADALETAGSEALGPGVTTSGT
jgi:hypothetical protein